MNATLEVLSGTGQVVEKFTIERRVITMGRADSNGLVMKDPLSSKTHAEISFVEGRFLLKDLGSRNGTFLNGQRLKAEAAPLVDMDMIRVGTSRVRFRVQGGAGAAGGPSAAGGRIAQTITLTESGRAWGDAGTAGIERIKEATGRIAAAADPVTLLEELLAHFFELAAAEAAEVVLLEPGEGVRPLLRLAVDVRATPAQKEAGARFGVGTVVDPNAPPLPDARPIVAKLYAEKRAVEGSEVAAVEPWSPDRLRDLPARLGVPIVGAGRLYGYVYVERAAERGAFSPPETARLGILCDALAGYLRSAFED